jgi:hypothetical protein
MAGALLTVNASMEQLSRYTLGAWPRWLSGCVRVLIPCLQAFDLIGTLVFALQGAMAAIRGELDFLGLLVLATMTRGASYCTAVYRLCPAGDPGACLAWDHSPCT